MQVSFRYPVVLAAAALLILGGGMLLKPQRRPVEPVLSETETVRLQQLAQRKRLRDMSSYFASVAETAAPSVVRVEESGASGILWDAGGVVTVPRNGGLSPDLPVERVDAPQRPGFPPAARMAPEEMESGAWVVHVARSAAGKPRFVPGVFAGVAAARCGEYAYREVQTSVAINPAMAGGGIFDIEGRLLAVIGRCGDRLTAVSVESVVFALAFARSPAERVYGRFGLRLEDTAGGVMVREVRRDSPAAAAGLMPGDVIAELGGEPAASVEAAERRLLEGDRAELATRRGRRARSAVLDRSIAALPREPHSSGLVLQAPPEGVLIESVEPASAAMRAGIRPGDRLLRADGRPVASPAAALRALAAAPVYLTVRRGASDIGFLLQQ